MKYFIPLLLFFSFGLANIPALAATKSAPVKKIADQKYIGNVIKVKKRKITTPLVKKLKHVQPFIYPRATNKTTPSYDKPVEDYLNSHSGIENPLLTPHYNLPSGVF